MASRESSLRHRTAQQKEPLLTQEEDDHTEAEPKKARRNIKRLAPIQERFTMPSTLGIAFMIMSLIQEHVAVVLHLGHHLHLHGGRRIQLTACARWTDSARLLYSILQDIRTQRSCVSVMSCVFPKRSPSVKRMMRYDTIRYIVLPDTMCPSFIGSMRFILESSPRTIFREATFSMSILHSPR